MTQIRGTSAAAWDLSGSFGFAEQQVRRGRIRCPVTILFGEEDQWIPIARGRTLAARIAEVRFYAMPQAGHLVQEDAPGAIVAAFAAQYGSQRERSGA
jgi:pimeloyl-ACP methyl ester carboxylesterase